MQNKELSVVEVIKNRIELGSKPECRQDDFKIGLVIEGGAMRGVISGGMVTALEDLKAKDAFDAIYSVSAGSCAGAYFLADQTRSGTSIYYENINNRKFIDPVRIIKRRPIVDIPFLTYNVMVNQKPLDTDKILNSAIPLNIYVSSALDGEIVNFNQFNNCVDILNALHWTCRMPVVAGLPIKGMGGRYYSDGGVLAGGIPIKQAIQDDCTHILALITIPEGFKKCFSLGERLMVKYLSKSGFSVLASRYFQGTENYLEALDMIKDAKKCNNFSFFKLEAIQPEFNSMPVKRWETNTSILLQGAVTGYNEVKKKFR